MTPDKENHDMETIRERRRGTAVLADGSAVLSPADLVQVLGALAAAEELARDCACRPCGDCAAASSGLCADHLDDFDQADAWQAVLVRLGASEPGAAGRAAAASRLAAAEIADAAADAPGSPRQPARASGRHVVTVTGREG